MSWSLWETVSAPVVCGADPWPGRLATDPAVDGDEQAAANSPTATRRAAPARRALAANGSLF
jgi:hypothetical protein